MCDTFVALGNSTKTGRVFFAKNSDREPNEAHELVIIPAKKHSPGDMIQCTYVEIPQVEETYQVLLAKPFWIWGAEMGSNEYGVTIGNEAVFTRDPYGKEPGLIGMDFLRLALERSKTAYSALMTIVELLERYGQSGNCGFAHKMYYHNSFLICDPDEAWVLETSAKNWAAQKVKTVRSISNAITIDRDWDMASKDLVTHAIEKGWCRNRESFSFSRCYSEPVYTFFSDSRNRQSCTNDLLVSQQGKIDTAMMMKLLRHHRDEHENWSPDRGITGADVCMHAGWGPIRGSQSAGSMISEIDRSDTVHWVTGTAAPCTSLFKPVWMDCGIPDTGISPRGVFDERTLYWRHEFVHRSLLMDYPGRISMIKADQTEFEEEMLKEVSEKSQASYNQRKDISQKAFQKADELESRWFQAVTVDNVHRKNSFLYQSAWKTFNRQARIEIKP